VPIQKFMVSNVKGVSPVAKVSSAGTVEICVKLITPHDDEKRSNDRFSTCNVLKTVLTVS